MSARNAYRRTPDQLQEHASKFWPSSLTAAATELSVIPLLLETQDQFLAILNFPVREPGSLFDALALSSISANLFLKHLMVLTDVGGEPLQRINSNFNRWFPDRIMRFDWHAQEHVYHFRVLPLRGTLSNTRLGVTGNQLAQPVELHDLLRDVIALLIFGAASQSNDETPELEKCDVSHYIGQPELLKEHVKQRYIWVSRITAGSQSNNLGHLAEEFVFRYLVGQLDAEGVQIVRNGTVPGVSHTVTSDDSLTRFDIVATNGQQYVAIEITFQVTTNSVIERKAREAQTRYHILDALGHKVAYVIDGAGNFQRDRALTTLCDHSHCTVAFSDSEL